MMFSPVSESDLLKIIKAKTKACELDFMGTDKLKEVIHTCILSVTKIINLSFDKGVFSDQWKTAVVKPLIKAIKKGMVYTNYRPVSNLSFISEVRENAHCNSLHSIVLTINYFHNSNPPTINIIAVKQVF